MLFEGPKKTTTVLHFTIHPHFTILAESVLHYEYGTTW
jgi:hypothetical protein